MFPKGLSVSRGCPISSLTAKAAVAGATLAMLGIMASTASATIIYQDALNGSASTPLNGSTPAVDRGSATWTADPSWSDNGYGTTGTSGQRLNAYLPFTAVAGQIYTLSAGLDVTTETVPTLTAVNNYWFGLGFMTTASTQGGWDSGGASPWVLNGMYGTPSSDVNAAVWTGPALAGGQSFSSYLTSGVNSYSIVLNTSTALWSYQVYLTNSTYTSQLVGSSTNAPFANNPTITAVGLQNAQGAGFASNFSLIDVAVPEPATLGLLGIGALGLLLINRRRTA